MRSALRRVSAAGRAALVLVVLYALWEGFKWFGEATGLRLGASR